MNDSLACGAVEGEKKARDEAANQYARADAKTLPYARAKSLSAARRRQIDGGDLGFFVVFSARRGGELRLVMESLVWAAIRWISFSLSK